MTDYYLKINNIRKLKTCHKLRIKMKLRTVSRTSVEVSEIFNQKVNGSVFKSMFEDFVPKKDYENSYLKILNNNYHF